MTIITRQRAFNRLFVIRREKLVAPDHFVANEAIQHVLRHRTDYAESFGVRNGWKADISATLDVLILFNPAGIPARALAAQALEGLRAFPEGTVR